MNLELNFTEHVNPNISKYTKSPIEFRGDDIIILKNWVTRARTGRMSDSMMSEQPLLNLNSFLDTVDEEEFAKTTSLEFTRKLQEEIDNIERYYGQWMRDVTGIDYYFEVKRNFDWKNGIYDFLKAYTLSEIGHNKKNCGLNHYFKRIETGRRSIRNLGIRFEKIDRLRKDCKQNVGKVVENIDEVIESFNKTIQTIDEQTKLANQMSPNYQIYNAVNFCDFEEEPPYNGFLNLDVYTIVTVKPNTMSVIDNKGSLQAQLPTPALCLVFRRPLSKVLLNRPTKGTVMYDAATVRFQHPYISGSRYYNLNTTSIAESHVSIRPWTYSLCLSSYSDDIIRSLSNNDYMSFVLGISSWNSIYNNEYTTPHQSPGKIYSQVGINPDATEDELQTYKQVLGFRPNHCFQDKLYAHRLVEDDRTISRLGNDAEYNHYSYGKYVVNECDNLQCPLRNKCISYNNTKAISVIPDFEEMFESIIGFQQAQLQSWGDETFTTTNLSHRFFNEWSRIHKNNDFLNSIGNWFAEKMERYDYGIIINNEENNQEVDTTDRIMQETVLQWQNQINSQGR